MSKDRISKRVNAQHLRAGNVRKARLQNGKAYEAHQPNNGKRNRKAFKKPSGATAVANRNKVETLTLRNEDIIRVMKLLRAEYDANQITIKKLS